MPRTSIHRVIIGLILLIGLAGCQGIFDSPIGTIAPTTTATPRSVAVPATATPDAVPAACSEQKGVVTDVTIPTELLSDPIQVKVYTPPCYDRTVQYPVLYMLHGMTYLNDQWVRIGLTDAADRLIDSGEISPLIIVMPQEDKSMDDSNTSGYGTALVKSVVPWIDQHYSTCQQRGCRAIGGLSRGGNWAVRVGLTYWQTFGAIGAHSAPLFFNDLGRISYMVKKIPDPNLIPAIYIDIGDNDDEQASAERFDAELTRLKIPHEFNVSDGYHEEAYWSAHVEDYLRWYDSVLSPVDEN